MTAADRSWVEVQAPAFVHNLEALRAAAPQTRLAAVIKADAYGHGLSEVARMVDPQVDFLAVANVMEAVTARGAGATKPILILGPALPTERPELVRRRFIPTISTAEEAHAYGALVPVGARLPVHLVIDTGMGRIGLWGEEAEPVVTAILSRATLALSAVSSHLPVADEDETYSDCQIERFHAEKEGRLQVLEAPGTLLNSAGILRFGERARPGDIVRAGLALYGISPIPEFQPQLAPALTWKARVSLVRQVGPGRGISYGRTYVTDRPTLVGTLTVGYGDGYQRHLSGSGADVLVRGVRCPVLGRVTMDQVMVDLGRVGPVSAGEEVVLIGRQGAEEILASELAAKAGTIAWEIFTGITKRVLRRYP
ncbi:MAG TPA: alanine racemase [Chthoniobacterales bacterium]